MATETKTYGMTEAAIDISHQREAEMIYASLARLADGMTKEGTGSEGEHHAIDHVLSARMSVYKAVLALQNQTGITPIAM